MDRYYFDLYDNGTLVSQDDAGIELAERDDAIDEAFATLGEVTDRARGKSLKNRTFSIIIRDADGGAAVVKAEFTTTHISAPS